jgi:polyferredoxin
MAEGILGIQHGRLRVELGTGEIIGHAVIWIIISFVTLGVGLFFYPYALAKTVLNSVYILDASDRRVGRLQCELSMAGQVGHIIIWLLISILTLGFGYIFYLYKVWTLAIAKTKIV